MNTIEKLKDSIHHKVSYDATEPSVIIMHPRFWHAFLKDCNKQGLDVPKSEDPTFENIIIRRSNDVEDGTFEVY